MSSRAAETARDRPIAQNITQTIECDQSRSERFLAPLGMTTLLLNGRSIASHKIDNCKWHIQSEEEQQRQSVHLYKVKRLRIGEKTQNRKCFRFMQQESVIKTGQFVSDERNHKIKLRPEKHANDRHGIWPVSAS